MKAKLRALFDRLPPRGRKWLPRLALAWVVYSLVGFFVLPPLLKWQMLKNLPAVTRRQAAIRQVKVNPWTLSLTIRGLALTESDGRLFASWEEFYANFQLSSLFRWAWTFQEIRLVNPFGEIILLKDGRLNFANMFEQTQPAPPKPTRPASLPRLAIFRLQITNGFVALEDRTRRTTFRTEYRPINLNLTEFTTRPGTDTPYSFKAESDSGRSLTWSGNVSAAPLRSSGTFELTGVRIPRYQPYFEDFTRARVADGTANIQAAYRFEASSNGVDLVVSNGVLQVAQFQLQDPDTGETVFSLPAMTVDQARFNFRERDVRLGSVQVNEAAILARLKKDGTLNLLGLLTLSAPATNKVASPSTNAPATPFTLTVEDFTIAKAAVTFEDLTRRGPFQTELKPVQFNLKQFTTRPDADAAYTFAVTTEAAEQVTGNGTVSINPIRSGGEVRVEAVELKKYLPYVEDFFRGRIVAGKVDAQAPYRFALATNSMLAGVSNLMVKVTGLEIQSPDTGEKVVSVAEFALERVTASLEQRQAQVGLVRTSGGSLLARRGKDGAINLLGLLKSTGSNAPAVSTSPDQAKPPASSKAAGWTVRLDEIAVDNYAVKLEDQQLPKPATFRIDQVALNLKGVSTVGNAPVTATLALRFNEAGAMAVRGTARPGPVSADFDVAVTNLDLRAFQPYVEQQVRLSVVSALFSTAGKLHYQPERPGAPLLAFTGGMQLSNFVTTDQVVFKEFVRWEDLAVSGIDCALQPSHLKVDELKWRGLKTSILIGPDKKPNFAMILKQDAATNAPSAARMTNAPSPGPAPAAAFPVQIGAVLLENASFNLTDQSIQPPAEIGIQELSGSIKGLSSALDTTAAVALAGKVDQESPFGITGRVNPLASDPFIDLVITNRNTQLTSFTSYMEKYGGHPLNKGRLTTSLQYHLEHKQLKAENKIQIDQLTLGPRNSSPDATKLPVKLGVALLKDRHGRIELDVPVSGRLDDPQFRVGPIILKVVLNLIAKAATSPFSLLGALVGGGEELSFVAFTPGTTNVTEAEIAKLGKLSKALFERPAVNLEIEGAVDPARDREPLALEKLRAQIKSRRLQELAIEGKASQSMEAFTLEPADQERLLRVMFVEQFGTNITAILQTNALFQAATNAPPAAAARPQPKKGLLKRALGSALSLVGLGPSGPKLSPTEKRLSKADRAVLGQATPEVMEALLAEKIEVTPEDFRKLMTARAQWVQDYLQKSAQVAPERLFLIKPKPLDANYKGECQVNLSLN